MVVEMRREALPQDISAYQTEARAASSDQEFQHIRPHPFLLYARSTLWDPALVAHASGATSGETRLVDYNLLTGGMAFLAPIRKLPGESVGEHIILGRAPKGNDIVVPVSSVSSHHAEFHAPRETGTPWRITDLGSRNGTYIKETLLRNSLSTDLTDGDYLRLGGNLIAWFLSSSLMWQILCDEKRLAELINL